jgi:glycosyltransferase involved in cell wall biosynthesis
MKICILSNAVSVHTQRWAGAFAERGHDVHLLSISHSNIPGVEVHTVNIGPENSKSAVLKFLSYLYLLLTARRRILQIKPDIVNAHYATTHGVIAAFAGYHPLAISVWGADVIWDYGPRSRSLLYILARYALKRADLICSTSKFMADRTVEILKPRRPIEHVPFGVDCQLFSPLDAAEPHQYPDQFRIGFVKTLSQMYGPAFLIESLPIISQQVPNAHLIMAGGGEIRDSLRRLAERLGVDDRVEFTGYVPKEKVPALMRTFDVLVHPSLTDSESFGVAVLEAQACGVPVVATRVGGVPEVCVDQKTGFLVPPGDPEALAEKVITLAKDSELRKQMGMEARKFVLENYQWQDNVEKMLRLLTEQAEKK